MDAGDLTNEYVRNRQLLINLAKGVAQLVVLSNKVTSLAGYTARVSELLEMVQVLDTVGVKPFSINDTWSEVLFLSITSSLSHFPAFRYQQ